MMKKTNIAVPKTAEITQRSHFCPAIIPQAAPVLKTNVKLKRYGIAVTACPSSSKLKARFFEMISKVKSTIKARAKSIIFKFDFKK